MESAGYGHRSRIHAHKMPILSEGESGVQTRAVRSATDHNRGCGGDKEFTQHIGLARGSNLGDFRNNSGNFRFSKI